MKKLFSILAICLTLASCSNQPQNNTPDTQVNVVVQQKPVGLDLQALGDLAKKSTSAQDLEQKLNQPDGINNVDLDGDGKVDYLNVAEFGASNGKGFSVVDYTKNTGGGTDTNEIANITFQTNSSNPNQANVNINGNTSIYGTTNSNYQTTSLLTDLLIYHYLFSPHSYYYSPYHYGYYPGYYHPYGLTPYGTYNRRVATTYRTTTYKTVSTSPSVRSPYAGKTSPSIAAKYTPPARTDYSSQKSSSKSFNVRSNDKPVNNSGFKSSSSSSYSPSSSSSSRSSGSSSSSRSSSSRSGGFSSSSSRSSSSSSRSKKR